MCNIRKLITKKTSSITINEKLLLLFKFSLFLSGLFHLGPVYIKYSEKEEQEGLSYVN